MLKIKTWEQVNLLETSVLGSEVFKGEVQSFFYSTIGSEFGKLKQVNRWFAPKDRKLVKNMVE